MARRPARRIQIDSGSALCIKIKCRLEKHSIPVTECGCTLWIGATREGYGQLMIEGKTYPSHRLSYAIHKGMINDGEQVLHKCDVPACINPEHLFLGNDLANVADCIKKGRRGSSSCEDHGMAKLTEDQVRSIIKDRRKLTEIASDYGISFSNVSMIRLRRTWKDLSL